MDGDLSLEGVFRLRRLGVSYTLRSMVVDVLVGIVFGVLVGIVFGVLVRIVFGVLVGVLLKSMHCYKGVMTRRTQRH